MPGLRPGQDDLDSETDFEIYDASGNLVQEVTFHTSCSQDLRIGDRFGSLEAVGFVNDDQGVVQNGGEVEYLYTVENTGTIDVFDLFVTDDPLGDIGGIASLVPGESVTLTTRRSSQFRGGSSESPLVSSVETRKLIYSCPFDHPIPDPYHS